VNECDSARRQRAMIQTRRGECFKSFQPAMFRIQWSQDTACSAIIGCFQPFDLYS